ncbi:hypothetical protein M9Y10_041830 [Tritrichomonas musculus]|uniref:TNFR-Cys domain-containing protein n=1 Tax=Tritrichomonas musculus TaxID=1915356 RepID=A0ABR2K795_9EUKA
MKQFKPAISIKKRNRSSLLCFGCSEGEGINQNTGVCGRSKCKCVKCQAGQGFDPVTNQCTVCKDGEGIHSLKVLF